MAARPAGELVPVSKVYGPVPPAVEAAEARSQMTPASPFSPGPPIGPYDGYSRQPREFNFVTNYNVATRPRTHERVSFETLTGLIESYDVAQIVIAHRIDSVRSLDWQLVAADWYDGDVKDEIAAGMKALKRPDRVHLWETWLGKWLYDELSYGCGPLYRLRNRGGKCIGLMPADVRTFAPLLDYWGLPPGWSEQGQIPDRELPPAFQQYVNGLPWDTLTRADLIYEPYRLHNNSPYGYAPIEAIIINANTDIRTQLYFLERFTKGSLPAAFANAPENWTPTEVQQFQDYWDGIMYGNQEGKHQVKWIPGGSSFVWSNEKEFTDAFSLHLMRKTCAAFHVVPSDMGFTQDVNRSSGESQADVAHRVGDLPFARYIASILTCFLQDDLGLPLQFAFDLGEEQADRADQAQADKIYVDMGAISASKIGEMRYGLSDPQTIPRYVFTERSGPIPLASLFAVAGEIDQATGLPAAGAPLPRTVFGGTEGVLPTPPIQVMPLAEQEFGPQALPPAPPQQEVAKEGEGPGITAGTGIYGDPLLEDDEDEPEKVAKETAAFRRYARARRKAGEWRDFRFTTVGRVAAHRLNDEGRAAVRKAAGELVAAGLAVLARDTGRVLMLQRALSDGDPAAGKIEFPGGHVEDGEGALAAAWREWAEETGAVPPPGIQAGSWTSADGVYQGIVWACESESMVPVRGAGVVPNPDDPDGSDVEAIMWVSPAELSGNPMVRAELAASLGDVLPLLGVTPDGECCGAECCAGGCCNGDAGCQCGPGGAVAKAYPDGQSFASHAFRPTAGYPIICHYCGTGASDPWHAAYRDVAKAGDAAPKDQALSAPEDWPGWQRDLTLSGIYAGKIRETLTSAVDTTALARDWIAQHPQAPAGEVVKGLSPQAKAFLAATGVALAAALARVLPGAWTEGYALGQQSAQASVAAAEGGSGAAAALGLVDWGGWEPGDPEAAFQVAGGGLRDLLADQEVNIESITSSRLDELGDVLAEHLSSSETSGGPVYSVDSLASALRDVLDNPARAYMVAVTEIARAASAAATATYQAMGVTRVRVSTAGDARVCPVCRAAEERGPVPLGEITVPLHPACRCSQVVVSLAGATGSVT
jgi:8-oxo-dGTP pyrophosphatase MutT (NUDIX family)